MCVCVCVCVRACGCFARGSESLLLLPSTFFLFCCFSLLLILFFISHCQSDESDAKVRSRHTSHLMCFLMKLFIKHMKHYKWLFTLTEICSDKETGCNAAITIQFTVTDSTATS